MRHCSFDQTSLQQFVTLAVPVISDVVRWGNYIGDFDEDRLKRSFIDTSDMTRTVIGAVSPIVAWAIGKDDPLRLRRMVLRMRNGACNLFVLDDDYRGRLGGNV